MKKTYYSNGKLLLTGEYVVLDGAKALAIPTRYGQSLEVETSKNKGIIWKSLDDKGAVWYKGNFELNKENIISKNSDVLSTQLLKILRVAKKMNPRFLDNEGGFHINTKIDFPRNWGLGTSSTLVNNIAQWAKIDAFSLLAETFGGSGYDIAAAQNDFPILYERKDGQPNIKKVHLSWDFLDSLFFVHLNRKQDSAEGIASYRKNPSDKSLDQKISDISEKLLLGHSLHNFEKLMDAHEIIISEIIKMPTIKESLFKDYSKTIKSLGAWGGDFVLATGDIIDRDYFRNKGYHTIIPFDEMIL